MEGAIDAAAAKHVEPGYVPLHRLNRREYTNAVRDLFDLEFDPASLLPQDDLSDGFDNVAKVLQVSPTFLDQYLAAARTRGGAGGGQSRLAAGGHALRQSLRRSAAHPCGRPAVRHARWLRRWITSFPADGEYELNINDMARALWVEGMEFENTLVALVDGVKVYEVEARRRRRTRRPSTRRAIRRWMPSTSA